MLLPRNSSVTVCLMFEIGFFLHIPFPSFEIFRVAPGRWRKAILEGLLGADLVGFHTYEYSQHFLQSVLRILGHEHQMGRLVLPSHVVHSKTFPMGIDFDKFATGAGEPAVEIERNKLREEIGNRRLILSVDRLDYTKGILNRLQRIRTFAENRPGLPQCCRTRPHCRTIQNRRGPI